MKFNRTKRFAKNDGRPAAKTKRSALALVLSLMTALTMTACSAGVSAAEKSVSAQSAAEETGSIASDNTDAGIETVNTNTDMFSDRDLAGTYNKSEAVRITLSDSGIEAVTAKGKAVNDVSADGQTVTITDEGIYILSGSLSDGQIVVDAGSSDKIQLVLDGVDITNDSSAAIYVKSADKVFVTLAEGSVNALSNTGSYVQTDENNVDSVIFSKDDLTLNGTGTLTVSAKYGHGVVSKDDLVLAGVTLAVTAEKKALDANDSVRIASGTYDLTSGSDAIHAADSDKNEGFVYIAGGSITISAGDDGIHALSDLTVDGGDIKVTKSYEGLEGNTVTINAGTVDVVSNDDGINAAGGNDSSGFGGKGGDMFATDTTCLIQINGGTVHVNAEGDGIDSNGSIEITGGTTFVEGPQNNGNGSLDVGGNGTATITGGYFVATGSSGMAVNFSSSSTQGAILLNVNATTGDVTVKDASGNVIASETTSKQFNCVQVSTPEIRQGETYTITAGGTENTVTMDSLIYGSAGGMGGFGGRGGMQNGNGSMDGNGGMQNGNGGMNGGFHGRGSKGMTPGYSDGNSDGISGATPQMPDGSRNGTTDGIQSRDDASDGQIANKSI